MRKALLAYLSVAVAALQSVCVLGAPVEANDVKAQQRYPWNGLVDFDFTVSGVKGKAVVYTAGIAVTNLDTKTECSAHSLVSQPRISSNGTYRLTWDAEKDLGKVPETELQASVVLTQTYPRGVQLWENGPYWAETNIGAEKPEDYGYYFWWGDTKGYKRANDQWVASDGSVSGYEFNESNTPEPGHGT